MWLSVADSLAALLVGQLANKLLPARLGDLLRVYFIAETSDVGKGLALATTLMEKALDGVMLLVLIALLSPLMPIPSWLRRSSLLLSAVLAMLLVAVMMIASQRQRIARNLGRWMERSRWLAFLTALQRLVEASGELRALRHAGVHVQLWGWSMVVWAAAAATNLLVIWALDLKVSPIASIILLVVIMTGAAVPAAPLQLGVFHYLCVLTLSLFGVQRSVALSYAVVLHLVVHVPIVVGGPLALWLQGLGFDWYRMLARNGGG
jgi:uncharacterized protein (TIRG00374 family)